MSEPVINIDVASAVDLVESGAFLLDVRENDEWESGRAPGATHVPLSEVPDHLDAIPMESIIVCICRAGARSARAAEFLAEKGYATRNVEGGMQAWAAAELPLVGDHGVPTII